MADGQLSFADKVKQLTSKPAAQTKGVAGAEAYKAAAGTPANPRQVPAGHAGEFGKDSRGYSVLKAAAVAVGAIDPDRAKYECHVANQLRAVYAQYPGFGAKSFLVPASPARIPTYTPEGYDIPGAEAVKKELGESFPAGAAGSDPGYRTKALGTIDDTAGGSLVAPPMLGDLIELQRNMQVFTRAKATDIPLPANGRLLLPKQTGGATAYWVGEGNAITSSQQSTGSVLLQGKKLGVLVSLNNEFLRYTDPAAEGMVRTDMATVSAIKADLAMLEGTGGTQIKGILTYDTQTSWTAGTDKLIAYAASTVATNGDTFAPEDPIKMYHALPDVVQNAPDGSKAYVMRPNYAQFLMAKRADAVSAADGKGPFLFQAFNRDPATGKPTGLYGCNLLTSSQVSNARVKGSGTNLTYVLLGYFPDWVIARFGVMEFAAFNGSDTAISNDQTILRSIQILDAAARHAASFVLCDSLLPTTVA